MGSVDGRVMNVMMTWMVVVMVYYTAVVDMVDIDMVDIVFDSDWMMMMMMKILVDDYRVVMDIDDDDLDVIVYYYYYCCYYYYWYDACFSYFDHVVDVVVDVADTCYY